MRVGNGGSRHDAFKYGVENFPCALSLPIFARRVSLLHFCFIANLEFIQNIAHPTAVVPSMYATCVCRPNKRTGRIIEEYARLLIAFARRYHSMKLDYFLAFSPYWVRCASATVQLHDAVSLLEAEMGLPSPLVAHFRSVTAPHSH